MSIAQLHYHRAGSSVLYFSISHHLSQAPFKHFNESHFCRHPVAYLEHSTELRNSWHKCCCALMSFPFWNTMDGNVLKISHRLLKRCGLSLMECDKMFNGFVSKTSEQQFCPNECLQKKAEHSSNT